MPVQRADGFFETLNEMLDGFRLRSGIEPIYLGGAGGGDGGAGAPPGGFIGQLAQGQVTFDTTERDLLSPVSSGSSLVDNLNRLRARANTTIKLLNSSGSAVVEGDVLWLGTSTNNSFILGNTQDSVEVVGIARKSISSGSQGFVSVGGYVPIVNVTGQVNRGDYLYQSTTHKKAYAQTSGSLAGLIGRAMSSGSTQVSAVIYLEHTGIGSSSGGGIGTVIGGGAANRVAFWVTAGSLGYDDDLRWTPTTNIMQIVGRLAVGSPAFTMLSTSTVHVRTAEAAVNVKSTDGNAPTYNLHSPTDVSILQTWGFHSSGNYTRLHSNNYTYARLYEAGWVTLLPSALAAINKLGVNVLAPFAFVDITQPVETTGSGMAFRLGAGAHTGMAVVEPVDVKWSLDRVVSFAPSASPGGISQVRAFQVLGPTYDMTLTSGSQGAMTLKDAATLYTTAPSTTGAITSYRRLWAAKFQGRINVTDNLIIGDLTSGSSSYAHADIQGQLHIFTTEFDHSIIVEDNAPGDGTLSTATQGSITFRRSHGTMEVPTAVAYGDIVTSNGIGRLRFNGYTSSGSYICSGMYGMFVDEAVTSLNVPGRHSWFTSGSSGDTLVERMRITNQGQLGLGVNPTLAPTKVHFFSTASGWWLGEVSNITTQTVVILPAGSVTYGLRCNYAARKTSLTTTSGVSVNISSSTTLITDAGGTFTLRVNADGSVDVRRTAGTDTLTICNMAINYV